MQQTHANATSSALVQWPGKLSRLRGINVLGAEVATVTVAVAVGFVWLMVAVVGLKLQLLPAGIAEQDAALRLNVPLKPFIDGLSMSACPSSLEPIR